MQELYPNVTFFIQLGIFFVAMIIINVFIVSPIAKILAGRSERIEGAEQEAVRLQGESAALDATYKEKLKEARVRAQQEKGDIRQEALGQERAILDKGRGEVQGILENIRQEIQQESAAAKSSLQQEAAGLSQLLAEKLLGRPVS